MTKVHDVAAVASEKLAKKLATFRIDARPYYRAPLTPELFAINIDNRQIRPWAGKAQIEVVGDRKVRQAVLTVVESDRSVTRIFDVNRPNETTVRQTFPVVVPEGRLANWRIIPGTRHNNWGSNWAKVEATMVAPPTSTSLLVGFDEIRQFIAQLPRHVNSVEAAHDALRPNSVAKGTLRQGEWFFVPVNKKERAEIEALLASGRHPFKTPLEVGSTHSAPCLFSPLAVNSGPRGGLGVRYATGKVTDTRKGRHAPLLLDDWYRVVRNAEVEAPVSSLRRTPRMWD